MGENRISTITDLIIEGARDLIGLGLFVAAVLFWAGYFGGVL